MASKDKALNNRTIKIGLKNRANMFQVVRGNFYVGVEIKNIPQHIRGILSGFLKTSQFVLLKAVRRITSGLCKGASDDIGFTMIPVSHLPPGATVAIFTAIENKQKGETFRDGQEEFLKMVSDAGGIAGVNRDGVFEWYSELRWEVVPDGKAGEKK